MVTSTIEKRKWHKVRDIRDSEVRGDGQLVAISRMVWAGLLEKVKTWLISPSHPPSLGSIPPSPEALHIYRLPVVLATALSGRYCLLVIQ